MKRITFILSLIALRSSVCLAQWVSGGTEISFSNSNHHHGFVSAADSDHFYVTWVATDTTSNTNSSVLLGAYDGGGNIRLGWVSGGITISNKGDHYAPQLITSEDEGVIVTWYGWDSTSNYSQIYIQKYSNKGVALWNSGKPVQVSPGKGYDCQYPMLVNDKHNGAYLTWMRYDTNLSASSPDIFLQHIDSTGKVATG
ncbi:MAG TPA: hypothetical protein VNZ45_12630, partial [Bacteroidia bacterium]|nr:hypothetical protein [Bacteroidia bacterium]